MRRGEGSRESRRRDTPLVTRSTPVPVCGEAQNTGKTAQAS